MFIILKINTIHPHSEYNNWCFFYQVTFLERNFLTYISPVIVLELTNLDEEHTRNRNSSYYSATSPLASFLHFIWILISILKRELKVKQRANKESIIIFLNSFWLVFILNEQNGKGFLGPHSLTSLPSPSFLYKHISKFFLFILFVLMARTRGAMGSLSFPDIRKETENTTIKNVF